MKLFFWLVGLFAIGLSGCSGYPRILSVGFDTSGRNLNSQFSETQPRMAGSFVVFTSDRSGSQDIYLYNATERRLIELPGLNSLDLLASHPSVTSDGRYIVFRGVRQARSGIYLYDRELRQVRNVTENLLFEVRHPNISADGQVITFESSENGQWDIKVIKFPFN